MVYADFASQTNVRPMVIKHHLLTSRHTMHLMLNEVIHQWHDRRKERASQVLPQLDRLRIRRTQHCTSNSPRQRGDHVRDHEDIVPIVIVRARDIRPPSARQCAKDAHSRDELGQTAALAVGETVKEEDEGESGSGADGDEDLEDGAFRVAVADGGADGGKPFDGVAVVLVLHDFGVVQGHADDEGADEGGIGGARVRPCYPVAVDLVEGSLSILGW